MADEGGAKEGEGDKKVVHVYPLVKVSCGRLFEPTQIIYSCLFDQCVFIFNVH